MRVGAAFFDGHVDELPDAADVEALERVALEDFLGEVIGEEAVDVVAAEAEGHLRQVVGAEAEELGGLGHFVGGDGGARDFDHRAVQVLDLDAGLLHDGVGGFDGDLLADSPVLLWCRPAES